MPTHPDAIGYIRALGRSAGMPWLEMICDLAANGETKLSLVNLEILVQLFTKQASYLRQPAPPALATTSGIAASPVERIETIGPFSGFKRLGDSLVASFPKRATIIFGTNGSGKSSLCDALQILASHDAPRRPLHDVRSTTRTSPSFSYKFATDAATQSWASPVAYGTRSSSVKYFDTSIAIHNVQKPVQPGRIIELSPFKLDVFETAKNHCSDLRTELQRRQSENVAQLANVSEVIRTKFEAFEGSVLANLINPTTAVLDAELKLADNPSEKSGLDEKLKRKTELEKATSKEGLMLLKGEAVTLKALLAEVEPILRACEKLVKIDPVSLTRDLKAKEDELQVLAKSLIPTDTTLDKLMSLIRPANDVCSFHSPETMECPLCRQVLRESELELFKQYAELLTGELDKAIIEIRELLKVSKNFVAVIADSTPDDWGKDSVLDQETVNAAKEVGKVVQSFFGSGGKIDSDCKDAAAAIRVLSEDLLKRLEEKEKLVQESGKNQAELLKQLVEISTESQDLLYAKEVSENIDLLKDARGRLRVAAFWEDNLTVFTSVLRKITAAAKTAHKELVVNDFKSRLNAEYIRLAEKDMSAIGVELKDVGGDGSVTVDHHVAGERIEAVLSEGELRIHALALFFAELETCEQQVIVFDDPISSFDYNYIGNFCNRLRDLIQAHSNKQVIVLTHNWEFFVQIQTALNASSLSGHIAVNVLEGCVSINEYSEKIDVLKIDIDAILAVIGEPTKQQKEVMAGKMRRLIESVVNTHVFNKQRHQFKQKSQPVSAFQDFTKVVPLLQAEAQTLRDLYAKLSMTEHDDPRTAYVNTDKAMFQTRYDSIKNIETAIVGRK